MTESDEELARALAARNLLRAATTASLATTNATGEGPYSSLVLMATDMRANPLLLMSDLAIHSQNIKKSPQVSLLVYAPSDGKDPLTHSRISVQGAVAPVDDISLQNRFLRRYPSTADYASFADFNFYRLTMERVHLVAGFGQINWIDGQKVTNHLLFLEGDEAEMDILDHMNTDHADAVQLLGGKSSETWEICGVDPNGVDLRSDWHHKRILFDQSAANNDDIRIRLIQMIKEARN